MRHTPTYYLLTFYKFVSIKDPKQQVADHKIFCSDIGMKWRIYIGEEGISATMSCNKWQFDAYMLFLKNNPYFDDLDEQIQEKITTVTEHQFEKMIVKYRSEIVALWVQVSQEKILQANKILSVDAFKEILDSWDDNREILDMRNDYEWKLWHFKWAIPAWTVNFREVQDLLDAYKEKLSWKNVLMYCTWWIRCEKLSALLHEQWVDNFYGLDWWVVKYTNTYNDGNRLWNLYTFDWRVSCDIGDEHTNKPIGTCIFTGETTNNCENCRYSPCNARIIADQNAYRKHLGFCSEECSKKAQNDLLIKNIDRDPVDYKSLRGLIKQDPTQKQAIIHKIWQYIQKKLLHITFNNKKSQKEKPEYQW